jgi:hypothetical protein
MGQLGLANSDGPTRLGRAYLEEQNETARRQQPTTRWLKLTHSSNPTDTKPTTRWPAATRLCGRRYAALHRMLRHAEPCCTMLRLLRHVTPCCAVWFRVAPFCAVLRHAAPCCAVLHHITPYCTMLRRTASC